MCDGDGSTRLHKVFQGILYQSLTLGIESRCRLVKYEYRWVFQDSTCNRYTLALSSTQSATSVSDVCVISVVAMLDKLVCVGNLCCFFHILLCGVTHSECDVVVETVIEEDSLLVYVSDEFA